MSVIRLSTLTLALALGGAFGAPLLASETHQNPTSHTPEQPVRVIASLPITFGLAEILLKGSGVTLERAAPASLPGSRQAAYFSGRGASELKQLATSADAVIGLRSIWPDDPLYPDARRSNIRIVEIDAARPVDGALPGVALQPGQNDGLNSQPWQSSNNLGRMGDVLATDLARLAPSAKATIDSNLAGFKQRLLKISAEAEAQLAKADNLSVMSLSERFGYLTSGLNLDLLAVDARPDPQWTAEALEALQKRLKTDDVAVVIAHRDPADALKAAIRAAGSRLLVLQTDSDDPLGELEGNIKQVTEALVSGS
ncbi:metal ABC transporter solute-binding protein, Zn/Mn family [Pseudomonas sp. LS-2]|jgi:ABC-type Zn uptake system ZnuABC Zn-binding protein ZnuA|uniref:metal ABC transporter solute-binding protein, Zn/Mn family n=1 Tax=Pseudomonas sp. LS-2 TaxID=2315859 RepID=UPI000E7541A1|nr:zinc ABC transporter substrate-binding protein [Pseudomonas sp. LS-2]RJX72481.1 metal ABC transporter substrate-binding protein [Pseudomonas sp. LS-2]